MYHNIKNPKLMAVAIVLLLVIVAVATISTRQRKVKDAQDFKNQVNYVENTKKLLDDKSFIAKLPYKTSDFDIFYSSVKDEVQIVMKNYGLSFEDTKAQIEQEVSSYLESIGVPSSQKIVWLLAK